MIAAHDTNARMSGATLPDTSEARDGGSVPVSAVACRAGCRLTAVSATSAGMA